MDLGVSCEKGNKWSDSGYVLEVELMELAAGAHKEGEKRESNKELKCKFLS